MGRSTGGPAGITINRNDRFVVCRPDGTIDGRGDDGFYAADSRFVSGYRISINGEVPVLLSSAGTHFFAHSGRSFSS